MTIGYKATLVNAEFHVIDGELTDACAGRALPSCLAFLRRRHPYT